MIESGSQSSSTSSRSTDVEGGKTFTSSPKKGVYTCSGCLNQIQYAHQQSHIRNCEERRKTSKTETKPSQYTCKIDNCNRRIQYVHEQAHNRNYHSSTLDVRNPNESTFDSKEDAN